MQSMTGFGRGEYSGLELTAVVEVTSVNRKQADIHFNLPRELSVLESGLRKVVLALISRGRITISISLEKRNSKTGGITVDQDRARDLETAFRQLSEVLGRPVQPVAADFLRIPEILSFDQAGFDPGEAEAVIRPALDLALESLIAMRTAEADDLRKDLLLRLALLEEKTSAIAARTPAMVERQRDLLHSRLREAGLDLDLEDERLLKEVALFAERCDVTEETTRLVSHLGRFRQYLASAEPVGRSLDFLCQEINREFNTIGSKANNAGIGQTVVEAKTELEKIREQVQNLE
jgi:uncharacterized protein (TIGR00255 family)